MWNNDMWYSDHMNRIVVEHGGNGFECVWFIGWLFTIGYLKLSFWKGVLALIIWPYYLGVHFTKSPHQG